MQSKTIKTMVVSTNNKGQLIDEQGNTHTPPDSWSFLPAGDAGITRRVTKESVYWKVVFKKGRRTMSKGVWAPTDIISKAKSEMTSVRQTEEYQKKKEYNRTRRDVKQNEYEGDFRQQVELFLNFHPTYQIIAQTLSILVTKHAIPIGSGTVARTARIPIQERASKAVIAWMRHHTTNYDNMHIPLIKGERRAVRRNLAQQSLQILDIYRKGLPIPMNCPIKTAIQNIAKNYSK